MNKYIYDLDKTALKGMIKTLGEPEYRSEQVWHGLYRSLWQLPEQFSSLPLNMRKKLEDSVTFSHLTPEITILSKDKLARKTLFRLNDGNAIETVMMIYTGRKRPRITLCVSTQSGCALGCKFCATGQMGFRRNLSHGEIIEQVLYHLRLLADSNNSITNIVYMGMGEPLLNYEATLNSIDIMNDSAGLDLGARRFTISTVGIVPKIRKFADEMRQVNLAISLHFSDNQTRNEYIPINRRYPIEEIIDVSLYYVNKTRRRISFEWALINNINDSPNQARALANLLKPFIQKNSSLCHVNLIPLNPTIGFHKETTKKEKIGQFRRILNSYHIPSTVRKSRGIDIGAGCGQLAIKTEIEREK